MSDKTKISWTDATWNPITGCTKVSPGCKYCYAERWANARMGQFAKSKERKFSDIVIHEDKFDDPIKWKRPRMIFVCSMSDLFHEKISFAVLDTIFNVMRFADHHIFQVLTKRIDHALDYIEYLKHQEMSLPKNVWFGVSIENQATADERIPKLQLIDASVKWLSIEPLLDEIDLKDSIWFATGFPVGKNINGKPLYSAYELGIDWIVVGGESGPKARPMNPRWVYKILNLCKSNRIPFFFKQWGEWVDPENFPIQKDDKWPFDITKPVHRFDNLRVVYRVGKKAAGNKIAGFVYEQYPSFKDPFAGGNNGTK